MKIKNHLNYDYRDYPGAPANGPSMAVPDQTMTIKELLERFTRGLTYDVGMSQIYDEDEDNPMPDTSKMDLVDIQEMSHEAQDTIDNFKIIVDEKQKAKVQGAGDSVPIPS